ncbi:efflux RND transporter periplasmic adaptor subunit [Paenibacillus sp. OV219]|uniref:efflux RND transporter periplasmic adaptor subunit n=1 Tax=Paenibacillus sp. OV219 TaxID=1884377 RepID=UPI0008C09647|nr:efflux RND transporter periplasmic adaptor subunit [Paenibacillus sp. OV219]SEM55483.1 RND family efflux transporter, MFP subunit [Paenibacillus sp. OV219]
MGRQDIEHAVTGKKKRFRLIAALFVSGLIVFTLYSNTLQSLTLTKVWTTIGRQGALVQSYTGSGVLEPITEAALSNKAGWAIQSVKVKAGDVVHKGQTLVVYESDEAENRYLDAKAQLEQQSLSIQGLQDRYVEAASSGDDIQLRSAKRDLKSAHLTMEMQQRNLNSMKADLVSNRELKAPFEGIVTMVGAVVGMASAGAGPDVQITSSSNGYQVAVQVPAAISEHLRIGQKLDVQVSQAESATTMEGIISGIENKESQINIVIKVRDASLRGGEQAHLDLRFDSAGTGGGILVPSSAIHKQGQETYVYVIEERKGPLGDTSHVRKMPVKTGDSNDSDTVVLQGIFPDAPIILESSEPALMDGERVRVMTK